METKKTTKESFDYFMRAMWILTHHWNRIESNRKLSVSSILLKIVTWQVNPFVSSQGCNKSHSSLICDAHLLQHSHSSQNIPVPGLHCGRSFFRPTETASGKSHGGHVAGHRAPLFVLYRAS